MNQVITESNETLKSYLFHIILISSIISGGFTGYYFEDITYWLKPIGDIFLNLLLMIIVPLIFFSISSAVASTNSFGKLGQIFSSMFLVFIVTSFIAAMYAMGVILIFYSPGDMTIALTDSLPRPELNVAKQFINIFSVSEFYQLFSTRHILPLIIFSMFIGMGVIKAKERGNDFALFLKSGEEVCMQVFNFIMYLAPIGFFAYFSSIVHELGPKIVQNYLQISVLYYISVLLYFIVGLSLFAYLAGKQKGVYLFWRYIQLPMFTSIATCSSAASIPANLSASKMIGVKPEVYETTIPLGALIHKDGSVMGGIFKIAFIFALFHVPFSGIHVLILALGVSMLVGTVMGGIPGGGMLGELLILSIYGFPPSALMVIAAISIIIDPIATMLNVTCNTVSTMLIDKLVRN
ncbi:dicarboxylate/amino acid:cation symporter [Legionella sp. W05-934-2]|jgi:Na+/H+-dicarboxylate symporter|uniref:dicarboxylate/amino acid:cation symporter n=1 Tax=Legionella sp. W05-934-2 TaxID=1198649 RepID=UPI0034620899